MSEFHDEHPEGGRHRRVPPRPDVQALRDAEAQRARQERKVAVAFYHRFLKRLRGEQ